MTPTAPSGHVDQPLRLGDRLLAEAVRALEQDGARPVDERQAGSAAAATGGDLERRIVERARRLSIAPQLEHALRAVRRSIGAIAALGLLLAAAAGASAAQAALGPGGETPVNIYWALGGLLGLQTILLAAWLVVLVKAPQSLPALSLGGAVVALGRRLAGRLERAEHGAAAVEAIGSVYTRGALAKSTLGAMSNGLWLAFNVACLLTVVLMLSARNYRFVWETTILSTSTYVEMTRVLGRLPQALGFPVPAPEQIAASDRVLPPDRGESARHAWSGFLVGCLFVYGLMPRLALLGACLVGHARARARYRLDIDRPGYLRLRPALMPQHESLGIVDAEEPVPVSPHGPASPRRADAGGPPVLIGLEIEPPASGWPPRAAGVSWRDFGFCDGRPDQERVLKALAGAGPATPVIVCALTSTPDRGIASFVEEIGRASGSAAVLVLTGGESMRRRGDGATITTRVEDWRRLAAGAGIDGTRVIEIDLDHLTDASAAQLGRLVGAQPSAAVPARRLEAAFDLVAEHASGWREAPGVQDQARLQEAVGRLYRNELASRPFLGVASGLKGLPADVATVLKGGAERAVGLLPARARLDPRWAAAGAVAGAIGCLAASILAVPAVIGALPAWSALGGVIAAAVRASVPGRAEAPTASAPAVDRGDAIRGAALFALLLELQGRGEAAITRVLDRALPAAHDQPDLDSPQALRAWLDGLRHRVDLALAREARP